MLPDLDVFKDELKSTQIRLSLGESEDANDSGNVKEGAAQSPSQTGVYERPSEEDDPSEAETPVPLRRSTRTRKPNPKYANVAIIEEVDAREPEMFDETSQNLEWNKAMEKEIVALD